MSILLFFSLEKNICFPLSIPRALAESIQPLRFDDRSLEIWMGRKRFRNGMIMVL